MKLLLLLPLLFSVMAHANCAVFLTKGELLKVDSRLTREIRRLARGQLYVRLNWYDSITGYELRYARDITALLHEKGETAPTHPAVPLIPPPTPGHGRLVRVMVRTPERLIPAIVNAELTLRDGVYRVRAKVTPAWREGEADRPRSEELIAMYTLLSAAPYVSRLGFLMEVKGNEHADFAMALRRDLEANESVDEAVAPFMDLATDFVLARPSFVSASDFRLRGYRFDEEVELDLAHDFRAEYEFTLDENVVERLSSAGRTLN